MTAGVDAARAAADQYDWVAALEAFRGLDADGRLGTADLERYSEAALWTGDVEGAAAVMERAFKAHLEGEDPRGAARTAIELCIAHAVRGKAAVASGWGERAFKLLESEPACSEWARLLIVAGSRALRVDHDPPAAADYFEQAIAMARDAGDGNARALGQVHLAHALAQQGMADEGTRLVDEAMTAAICGELDPVTTARVYCFTISLSQATGDIRRARERSDEAIRCSSRPGMADFPGDCRLHRAELTRLQGDWDAAQAEIERAIPEMERWDRHHAAQGWYELGEIALRRGDRDGAAEAFTRATGQGHDGLPGLAGLRILEGEPAAAEAMLAGALEALGQADAPRQAELLPVLVEASLAAGHLDEARGALARLEDLASQYKTIGLQGAAATARAMVAAAAGDADHAARAAREAIGLWREAEAPYETAVAQLVHAEACRRLGQTSLARLEAEAAMAAFDGLGAVHDGTRARALLVPGDDGGMGDRAVFTFMFTDVVDSTKLLAAMGDTQWSAVIDFHDRTIRALLEHHGGTEVKQRGGGDGFFAVFDEPAEAVTCALNIQSGFARHRAEYGFAPHVRIGIHRAEATHRDGDYFGLGVHAAARVAESAGADEVVVSVVALDGVDPGQEPTCRESRDMKGLPEPVEVAVFGSSAPGGGTEAGDVGPHEAEDSILSNERDME